MYTRVDLRVVVVVGLVAVVGALAAPKGAGAAVLAKDGKPTAGIVLGADPTCAAQFAACELQWHVREITGAELPIVRDAAAVPAGNVKLFVGDSPRVSEAGFEQKAFGEQDHVVVFRGDEVFLVGRDAEKRDVVKYDMKDLASSANWPGFWEERGTLDAVYDFLERGCGVRWFNPTESGTILPHATTLEVRPFAVRRKPAFEFRDAIGATGDNPSMYDGYVALWPSNTREFQDWERDANPRLHEQYGDPGAYAQAKRMRATLFLLRMRNGGKPVRCNHSLYGYYQRFWEKSADPEAAKLFVRHDPSMFAQGYQGEPPQMCYTSRALIDQLTQDARDYYDGKKTGADLGIFWRPTLPNPFPVEPMDNSSFCKCPECQKWLSADETGGPSVFSTGAYSDYFFNFINEVQKGLSQTHPGKSVVALAYASHAAPPKRVKLDPSVAIQFCFAANRSPAGRAEYEHEVKLLRAWASDGTKRPLYLWLYDTFPVETANNGKYHCFPGFFAHTIGEQFKLFRQYGYRGMFHCGYGQEVEAYVTFKLMDDPDANVDTLLDEYFTGLYGPAAGPMKQLYLEIEKTYSDPASYPKERLSGAALSWGSLGTEERMKRLGGLLSRARHLAQTDEQSHRIALFEESVWSYMTAGRKQYVERTSAPIPSVQAPRVADAGGDVAKVNWAQAADLGGPWYERGGNQPSARNFAGRIAHDGQYLYLELTDPCPTAKLSASPTVFAYDDWEVFVANQRATPYRQYAVGPTGLQVALSHGETNFRMNVELPNPGAKAVSDTSAADKWVTRLAYPLATMLPGGVKPGGKLYMNIMRISGPNVGNTNGFGLDTWVSYCTVHEVDRLGEVRLGE